MSVTIHSSCIAVHVGCDGVVDLDHRVEEDALVVIPCKRPLPNSPCTEAGQSQLNKGVPVVRTVAGGEENRAVRAAGIFAELAKLCLLRLGQLPVNDAAGDAVVRLQRYGDLGEEDGKPPCEAERLGKLGEAPAEPVEDQEALRADGMQRLVGEGAAGFPDVNLYVHGKPHLE